VTVHSTRSDHTAPAPRQPATPAETLIQRIATGDRRAMQELYLAFRGRVFRFVARMVHDEALAEDVVSEVFLDIWRQAGRYEGRSLASTWILSIARNKAFSALKRQPRMEVDLDHAAEVPDGAPDPEAALHSKSSREVLAQCLRALSSKHGKIIDLIYYQNKSVKEVAALVNIPESTVKTRMFFARKHLAQLLTAAGVVRFAS
jgi:RNA polymerase sigma-70 factor (ECF subfamily)